MSGFLKRALLLVVGIVLGSVVIAGAGSWRELFKKPDDAPPAPIQREPAPDTRV